MALVIDDRNGEWDAFVMDMLRQGAFAGKSLSDMIFEILQPGAADLEPSQPDSAGSARGEARN